MAPTVPSVVSVPCTVNVNVIPSTVTALAIVLAMPVTPVISVNVQHPKSPVSIITKSVPVAASVTVVNASVTIPTDGPVFTARCLTVPEARAQVVRPTWNAQNVNITVATLTTPPVPKNAPMMIFHIKMLKESESYITGDKPN